jgi:hypothetical protein
VSQRLKNLFEKLVIEPKVFHCSLFVDEYGEAGSPTAVVVPTKFKVVEDGVQITWSCSLLESCRCERCIYSKKGVRVEG